MLTDEGFGCTPNVRFTSCISAADTVRVAAWKAENGAASEIVAVFLPQPESDAAGTVLSLLNRIAPGSKAATEEFIASEAAGPQYHTLGRVNLTLNRVEGAVVSAVLRPA
jgi:hypothetical protein